MSFLLVFRAPYTTSGGLGGCMNTNLHSTHHVKAHLMISKALQSFKSQDPNFSQTTRCHRTARVTKAAPWPQTMAAAETAQIREKSYFQSSASVLHSSLYFC